MIAYSHVFNRIYMNSIAKYIICFWYFGCFKMLGYWTDFVLTGSHCNALLKHAHKIPLFLYLYSFLLFLHLKSYFSNKIEVENEFWNSWSCPEAFDDLKFVFDKWTEYKHKCTLSEEHYFEKKFTLWWWLIYKPFSIWLKP